VLIQDQNRQGPGGDLQAATRAEILGEEGDFPEQIKVYFRNLAGQDIYMSNY
jgi:hypothetical protein